MVELRSEFKSDATWLSREPKRFERGDCGGAETAAGVKGAIGVVVVLVVDGEDGESGDVGGSVDAARMIS